MTDSQRTHDPMGTTFTHKALVFSSNLQFFPSLLIVVILVFLASLLSLVWPDSRVPLFYLLTISGSWTILWLLPRAGRSFGPEKASVLALALVISLAVFVVGLFNLSSWLAYALMATAFAIVFYSTWVEPFWLEVTHERLRTPHLQPGRPLRLLHIGDLHVERISPRERQLNAQIEALDPDLIVFSGDFVNLSYSDDPRAHEDIREVIGAWRAPLGVYCVPGTYTVESTEQVKGFVRGLDNITLLLDQWHTVETPVGPLHILGMVTTHDLETDQAKIKRLMQRAPEGFQLLLTHAPDVTPEADALGMDLYLCGHTHGGQIRFPLIGAVLTGSHLGRRFVMGRHDLQSVTEYTTRGVGLEGLGAPRARFLCRPEIILWEIEGGT